MSNFETRMNIIKLLSFKNSLDEQQKGIELALQEGVDFVLECFAYDECVGNCAKIITSLSYEQSEQHFDYLLMLLQDLHFSWQEQIFKYIVKAPIEMLVPSFKKSLSYAIADEDYLRIFVLIQMLDENNALRLVVREEPRSNEILNIISSKCIIEKAKIIQKLHCENQIKTQQEGIELALMEDDLNFIMRYSRKSQYAKNCAKVFCSLPYQQCEQYFSELLNWMEDFNSVGAEEIFNYLSKAPKSLVYKYVEKEIEFAEKNHRKDILDILNSLLKA